VHGRRPVYGVARTEGCRAWCMSISREPSQRPLWPRTVFVSHAVADRKLATSLGHLIEEAFSAILGYYASSDPSPSGGLQPGDEWYAEIHARLRSADSVWVLATTESISHPWLYWEAGIGRALCPHGVVVLRVGVKGADIPSPLSAYQSYDALALGDTGIDTLLGKVANQLGMKLTPALVGDCTERWLAAAKVHTPELGTVGQTLGPEQVDRIEGLIGRLEGAVQRIPGLAAAPTTGLTTDWFSAMAGGEARTYRSRAERREERATRSAQRLARAATEATRAEEIRRQGAVFKSGKKPGILNSQEQFLEVVNQNPTLSYSVLPFDSDGDLPIDASDGTTTVRFWLRGEWVDAIDSIVETDGATTRILEDISQRVREDDALAEQAQ
jgi:hypothetical protein